MLIQQNLFSLVNDKVSGLSGSISNLAQLGISLDQNGQLAIDDSTLNDKLNNNIADVQEFFTASTNVATGSSISATATTSPWSPSGAIDGNTKLSDFGTGATGWKAPNGNSLAIDFGTNQQLTSLTVYGVDTTTNDILKSFDIQYWDPKTNAYTTYYSVANNTQKNITLNFPTGLNTSKIQLANINGTGSTASILDVQAFKGSGLGKVMDLSLSQETDAGTGVISSALDGIASNETMLTDEITTQTDQLNIETDRLRTQFANMETALGNLKSQTSYLTTQSASLAAGWMQH